MKFQTTNSILNYNFGSLNVIGLIGTEFFSFENGTIKKYPVLSNTVSQKPLSFNPLEYSNNIMEQAIFNAYYKKHIKNSKIPIQENKAIRVTLKPIQEQVVVKL